MTRMTFCKRKLNQFQSMIISRPQLRFLMNQSIMHHPQLHSNKTKYHLYSFWISTKLHQLCAATVSFSTNPVRCYQGKRKTPFHRKLKYQRSGFENCLQNDFSRKDLVKIQSLLKQSHSEYLFGRSVCEIAIKVSRRPIFRLLLNSRWELEEPGDRRIATIIKLGSERGIPIVYLNSASMSSLCGRERPHQGVCLEVGQLPLPPLTKQNLNDLTNSFSTVPVTVVVMLFDVKDPMNVGSLLRTCHYLGVESVIMTERCAPLSAITSKASAGAAEILPTYKTSEPYVVLQKLRDSGWDVIGTDVAQDDDLLAYNSNLSLNEAKNQIISSSPKLQNILDTRIKKPSIVIFGSEGEGIPLQAKVLCNKSITIQGVQNHASTEIAVPCLNVSAAAAIILHRLMTRA